MTVKRDLKMENQVKIIGLKSDAVMQAENPVKEGTELSILRQVQAGNKNMFRFFVEKYKGAAYGIALGFVRNQQDALDISQDAFVRAYRKLKSFDYEKSFYPWFYQILKNLCLDFMKKRQRRNALPQKEVPLYYEDNNDPELEKSVWDAMERLPFEHREIIILKYFRQCSYKEIAEITRKPVGTVMSSLYYSKRKLKSVLSRTKTKERGRMHK